MHSYFATLVGLVSLTGLIGCTSPSGVWFDVSYENNAPSYDTNPPADVVGFELWTYDRGTGEGLLLIGSLDADDEMPQFFDLEAGFYWLECAAIHEDGTSGGPTAGHSTTVGEGLDVHCHCDLDVVGAARGLYCDRGESSETGAEEG